MELADNTLINSILNGNEDDFSLLFDKYKRLVYNEALKFSKDNHDVDDISQEVFLRIYRSLALFNSEYRISTWITTITRNFCKTRARSTKYKHNSIEELGERGEMPKADTTPEGAVIRQEELGQVRSIVNQLPEEYRTPIILYYVNGYSYKELTAILNVPMTIVKNRIYRAKLILRRKLPAKDFYYY